MGDVVLVTGGAGYVGSHVCKALAADGYQPVVLDSLERGHRDHVRWGPLEVGDLADRGLVDRVLAAHAPSAVLHFAAYADVGESVAHPGRYYRNNVAGTVTLLEAMVDHGLDRLVFSSTCAVYGEPETLPITEAEPRAPISPYGRSKAMVEDILADVDAAHGLRSIALRYFNAAGADPDGAIGEAHDPETHLVPRVLRAAADGATVEVNGDAHPTPDGSCVRDYVHVSDLARAHVLALRRLEAGAAGGVVNLGTGRGASVLEVVEQARRTTGAALPTRIVPARPGDPPTLVAAAERAASELGWQPRLGLSEILADAWRWHRRRPSSAPSVRGQ